MIKIIVKTNETPKQLNLVSLFLSFELCVISFKQTHIHDLSSYKTVNFGTEQHSIFKEIYDLCKKKILSCVRMTLDGVSDCRLNLLTTYKS
jgi:hypothetical protein